MYNFALFVAVVSEDKQKKKQKSIETSGRRCSEADRELKQ